MKRTTKMTDSQARAYIQGEEPFDEVEYMKRHAERLYKGVVQGYKDINPAFCGNLKRTALHYLESESMNYNKSAKEKLIRFINTELAEYELPARNIYSKDGKYHNLDVIK